MKLLKDWLHKAVQDMSVDQIKSITGNYHYLNTFNVAFNS